MGKSESMMIQWFGHATFLVTSSSGTRILIDPANERVGYAVPSLVGVDAVAVSHEHADHAHVSAAVGQPPVVRGLTEGEWACVDQMVKDVRIRTVGTYHDSTEGSQRGKNAVFLFEIDGVRVVHLGDLGHVLSAEQVDQVRPVDVLMVPVGGGFTLDAEGATAVVEQLAPKIVLPMHYKTARIRPDWPGSGVEPFLVGKRVERCQSSSMILAGDSLPATSTVFLLDYETGTSMDR